MKLIADTGAFCAVFQDSFFCRTPHNYCFWNYKKKALKKPPNRQLHVPNQQYKQNASVLSEQWTYQNDAS